MLCNGMPFVLSTIGASDVEAMAVAGTCTLQVRFPTPLPFSFPTSLGKFGPPPTDVLAVVDVAAAGMRRDEGTTLIFIELDALSDRYAADTLGGPECLVDAVLVKVALLPSAAATFDNPYGSLADGATYQLVALLVAEEDEDAVTAAATGLPTTTLLPLLLFPDPTGGGCVMAFPPSGCQSMACTKLED